MADNKVVIKINYDKKHSGINTEPQTVTVWHIRRILVAALALVLIVIVLFSWFGGADEDTDTQIDTTEKVQQFNTTDAEIVERQEPAVIEKPVPAIVPKESAHSESVKKIDTVKKPAAIILDRKVIRASLNSEPKDDEPGEPIKSPLRVIPNQSQEVFYFSEIKNMKGKALFHRWSRNGQIVHQKQLDMKDKITKVWSSKTLSAKDKGEWQVQLTDKKGKVYSEVNFSVNPE
ncbi:DUF2914 domain-containing protein [Methylomonas rosea]|uniref:DUF2914 domain-containing protein n=1 Tax=Methylomonas rosea TaxID=2952227 RepID=A0ABT1TV90_9GAMM|nr:DUF2914 domain-containing protein [Methylomonas sp. WSC-7]MCQ8118440.1 DUF2914 domain-containing protein [Methylomonas sp. WSC-7]